MASKRGSGSSGNGNVWASSTRARPRRRRGDAGRVLARALLVVLALLVLVVAAGAAQLLRSVPKLSAHSTFPASQHVPGALSLPWPSSGQAAAAVEGVGVMGTSGSQTPVPIASLTKLMTAYVILHDHPLATGQGGPVITATAADAALFQTDASQQQSVAPIVAGEQLSERQLLQGLLIPSANNFATMLARWDAGTQAAFVAKMNATAAQMGLSHTHYADPAGILHGSVSNAVDQIRLAEADMAIPAFQHTVAMPQVTLPFGPTLYNYNYLIGHGGIVGVKTGSTGSDGGSFVAAVQTTVGGQTRLVLSCVLSQFGPSPLQAALTSGQALVDAAAAQVHSMQVVAAGTRVGQVSAAWTSTSANAVTANAVGMVVWPGMTLHTTIQPAAVGTSLKAGAPLGSLQVVAGLQKVSDPLHASAAISAPSLRWRLTRL